ncbi:MAG: hypothetical protein QM741_16500 [Rudaea sp.]|uniref:hypothetical protein n=1 Tax=Rudaea sp. TaxID=2136325 RepID=UPI0039E34C5A
MRYLRLDSNRLTGSIPPLTELGQLVYFNIMQNYLDGALPDVSGMIQLQNFLVSGNEITGSVPNISGFEQFENFLVGSNWLTGTVPTALSNLPNLQYFDISFNHLTGSVPALTNVPVLQTFAVGYNLLSGTVPMPPTTTGLTESLCPNPLTPASNPPTALDLALNAVTGSTPWSSDCTSAAPLPAISGITYVDPATADGNTVTLKARVFGNVPTGTLTLSVKSNAASTSSTTALCENVPLVDGVATCTAPMSADLLAGNVAAAYSGDAHNAATNAAYWQTNLAPPYTLSETSSAPTAQVGQAVDLVAAFGDWLGSSDDTLTFYDGDTVLCRSVPVSTLAPVQTTKLETNYVPQILARCVTAFATTGNHALTVRNDNLTELGSPSPSLVQSVVAAAPFDANQLAVSGSWYNASTSGQGLVLQSIPDQNSDGLAGLFGGWFTFDADGNPLWLTLQGQVSSPHGSSYALTLYQSGGGKFDALPKAEAVAVGSATLTFHDCSHASLGYRFDDGRSGTIAQARLTGGEGCTTTVPATGATPGFIDADFYYSGAWYDPNTSGQGLVVNFSPTFGTFFAAWYTYAPQAENQSGADSLRWFTLQAAYTPGDPSLKQVPIYAVIGGAFDAPTRTLATQVGTADITFTSCTAMTLQYNFTQGEYTGLSGTIDEQNLTPQTGCGH